MISHSIPFVLSASRRRESMVSMFQSDTNCLDAFESLEMNLLLQKKFFIVWKGLSCVSVTNGPFMDGRTTGIEPARGGLTIHCLDPLGYIRPYPRSGFSLYLRSDPF